MFLKHNIHIVHRLFSYTRLDIYYRLKKVVGFYYSLVLVIKVTSSLNFRLFAIQCIESMVRSNIDGLDRLHSLQARLKALFKDSHVNIKLSMKC